MSSLNKTALNPVHVALGGTMVDFGGWEMPLWYPSGAVREHLAVLKGAGLFDTSHMTVITGEGAGIRRFLNFALTRDIADLKSERAAYGIILDENGGAIDDAIIYPLSEDRFALVVNAGMGQTVIDHLKTLPDGGKFNWVNLSGKLAKVDLQGPASYAIIKTLVANADSVFEKFPYFSFRGDFNLDKSAIGLLDNTPLMLSRTGYTGELGFEIFIKPQHAQAVWAAILRAGESFGILPCGLAARDSLRAGAMLPLSHQDIGPWPFINNPWSMALPLGPDGAFTKNFNGRNALNPQTADHTLAFVGFDPRKVDTSEAKVIFNGEEIGVVLTAVADMGIGRVDGKITGLASPDKPEGFNPKGLLCGFIKVSKALNPGDMVYLQDARRQLKAEIAVDIRPGRTARKALK